MVPYSYFYILFMKITISLLVLFLCAGCVSATEENHTPTAAPSATTDAAVVHSEPPVVTGNPKKTADPLMEFLLQARENPKLENTENNDVSAQLELELREKTAGMVTIDVVLKNPNEESISSVQSWVSYIPGVVTGETITLSKTSPFTLAAPGEQNFNDEFGIAKIGVSTPSGKEFKGLETTIATLTFVKNEPGLATFDFFNPGGEGNTKVIHISENGPQNILDTAAIEPLIVVE